MPLLPTHSVADWLRASLDTIVPSHAPYAAERLRVWQQAPSAYAGIQALIGTIGMRLSPPGTAPQAVPAGISYR